MSPSNGSYPLYACRSTHAWTLSRAVFIKTTGSVGAALLGCMLELSTTDAPRFSLGYCTRHLPECAESAPIGFQQIRPDYRPLQMLLARFLRMHPFSPVVRGYPSGSQRLWRIHPHYQVGHTARHF